MDLLSLMTCSGADVSSVLEGDLAMSDTDDDSASVNHWPDLPPPAAPLCHPSPAPHHGAPQPSSSSRGKRPAEEVPASSAAKTAKGASVPCNEPPTRPHLPVHGASPVTPSRPSPALPAFAPRDSYVKLAFSGSPSPEVKLRWLSAVTKAFHLERDAAEVKMAALTSRFVYVSRQRSDILERITSGEFLSLSLVSQDSPVRPRKYPQFILTRYPVDVDHRLAEQYPGVYSSRRFVQDGSHINRIVIVWSLPDPPPDTISFDFLPLLPACEVRRLHNDRPWCYRCWGIGHISRYCSASPKCAWCAAAHESRECPFRPPPASTSEAELLPPPDPSRWKCPRCQQPGVNVWHGCTRRRDKPSAATSTPPPIPPPAPAPSQSDNALRKAVASLQARCAALEDRFASLDARIDEIVSAHAATTARLTALAATQETIASSVTQLAEKMDSLAAHLEKVCEMLPNLAQASSSRPSSPPHRSSTSRRKVHQ